MHSFCSGDWPALGGPPVNHRCSFLDLFCQQSSLFNDIKFVYIKVIEEWRGNSNITSSIAFEKAKGVLHQMVPEQ